MRKNKKTRLVKQPPPAAPRPQPPTSEEPLPPEKQYGGMDLKNFKKNLGCGS